MMSQETEKRSGTIASHVVDFFRLLPQWLTVAVVVFVLGYITALTVVAVITERQVEFLPPRIGAGPKQAVAVRIADLQNELRRSSDFHYKQVGFLREKLAEAREKAASALTSNQFSASAEYGSSARRYESDIEHLDADFQKGLDQMRERLDQIRKACE